ncbi:MAG: tetratricopeptide repeat protein [Anaerolineaceae bacterium]|nr:tetratricopeptide repeat protein [Anaerolineaceae bacterium]
MRKLLVFIFSLGLITAVIFPLYAQDSGGTNKILGVDIYQRALQELNDKKYEQAISDLSLVILLNPTFTDPYLQRAQSYLQLKNYDAALVDLDHLIKMVGLDPKVKGTAYTLRGDLYRVQSDFAAALGDYSAALRLSPDDANAYYGRGIIYFVQSEYEKSHKDMTQLASIAPDEPTTYYFLGLLDNQLKKYEDAVKQFDTYIKLVPNNPDAFAGRANAYVQQKQYKQALSDLNQAIQLKSDDPTLYLQRGLVQQKLGDEQASADDYLTWIKININVEDQKTNLRLRPGESQVVSMGKGQVYIFDFEGQAGQTISLSTSTQKDQPIDSLLILADNQLNPLTADDDSGGDMNAAITNYVLPKDGSYAVILSHAGGNTDGNVRLLMTVGN